VASIVHEMIDAGPGPSLLNDCFQVLGKIIEGGSITRVELEGNRFAPHRLDFRDDGLSVFRTALVSENNVPATASNVECGAATKSTAGTGNDCDGIHGQAPFINLKVVCRSIYLEIATQNEVS
jgi:hypothetical protein